MSQQNDKKRKKILLFIIIVVTSISFFIGFLAIRRRNLTSQQTIQSALKKKKSQKKSIIQKQKPKTPEAPAAAIPPHVNANIRDFIPQSGNLEQLTVLRADLEVAKLQAQIAKEREKLLPKPSTQPSAPAPQPSKPANPIPPSTKSMEGKQRQPPSPVVISIQGVDGYASATIRTKRGDLVTVRPGQRFDGGIVASIRRSGVQLQRGHNISTLTFE